jgi:putative endonuclease
MTRKSAEDRGRAAETVAAWFLRLKGYRILERRYRTKVGEIDLIARRGRALVFVEVKYRPSADAGLAAISPDSRARIRRAAELYLQGHPGYHGFDMRFDAVTVVGILSQRVLWPAHLENAF